MLLVDIGNTRLKWAIYTEGKWSKAEALCYDEVMLESQIAHAWSELSALRSIYMASVADSAIGSRISEWVFHQWGISVSQLNSQRYCAGVHNGYREYKRLGVDRWAAIVAAYQLSKGAVCVVDSGTALTCDAVSADGYHLGGFIVPGGSLQKQLLLSNTKRVVVGEDSPAGLSWGRDTTACVASGIIQSQLGLIERSIRSLEEKEGSDVTLVLTGGASGSLLPFLTHTVLHEPDLVLKGMLYMLAEKEGK